MHMTQTAREGSLSLALVGLPKAGEVLFKICLINKLKGLV